MRCFRPDRVYNAVKHMYCKRSVKNMCSRLFGLRSYFCAIDRTVPDGLYPVSWG